MRISYLSFPQFMFGAFVIVIGIFCTTCSPRSSDSPPDYDDPSDCIEFWPIPKASAHVPVALLDSIENYYGLSTLLEKALRGAGWVEYSYFCVPEGFALVSRIEQIREDGSSMDDPPRWGINIQLEEEFDLYNIVRQLFYAPKGYFRIIVFVVTPLTYHQEDTLEVTRNDAIAWLDRGLNRLPDFLWEYPVTDRVTCTAYIYEFAHHAEHEDAEFIPESMHTGLTHLQKSGIYTHLISTQ